MEGVKTLKIRITCSVVGTAYSYAKNSVHDAPEERAKDLVKAGYAELVDQPKEERVTAENSKRETRTNAPKK